MPTKYAISDIHGSYLELEKLLDKIAFSKADELYLLGDYIDRGLFSKQVIQHILDLQKDGYTVHCLRGNHEEMLLNSFESRSNLSFWWENGGKETMDSYGTKDLAEIPKTHLDFIKNLDWYKEVDNYILVHAGLDWFPPLNPLGNKAQLLWARHWQNDIDYDWLGDRYIIHGHTPQRKIDILKQWKFLDNKRWLDIDAGCCFGKTDSDYGYLCAFDMGNQEVFFV